MANFSSASQTNPPKIKLSITWRGIQPGRNSARAENLKNSHVIEKEI